MYKNYSLFAALILMWGCSNKNPDKQATDQTNTSIVKPIESPSVFQYSTGNALMAGLYDGDMSFGQMKEHGDFGLGTFNALDGEMIFLDNVVYRTQYNGVMKVIGDEELSPFFVTTHFRADTTFDLTQPMTLPELEKKISESLLGVNWIRAVKVTGSFDSVTTRSLPKQVQPYAPFIYIAKTESIFHLANVEGTLLGFIYPHYMRDLNVDGFHVHFITNDKKQGGHVLGCHTKNVKVEVATYKRTEMMFPDKRSFALTDLNVNSADIDSVEHSHPHLRDPFNH